MKSSVRVGFLQQVIYLLAYTMSDFAQIRCLLLSKHGFPMGKLQRALWWKNYATSTLVIWLKGVSSVSSLLFKY